MKEKVIVMQALVHSRSRARLLAGAALIVALITASCCPPALVDRGIEKTNKPVAVKKASS